MHYKVGCAFKVSEKPLTSVVSRIIGWNAKALSYRIEQVLFDKICLMRQNST